MNITVEYTAQLRVKTGQQTETFELNEGATVTDLLEQVSGTHDVREFLQGSLLSFIGPAQAGPDSVLHDGDRVTLLTPISGG